MAISLSLQGGPAHEYHGDVGGEPCGWWHWIRAIIDGGGAIGVGNRMPAAEFNIWADAGRCNRL